MIRKLGDPHFYFLTKNIGLLPNSIKTLASKFFPCLYQIHLNTGQSFGWQPLLELQARVKKKDVTKLYKTRLDQLNWSAISPLFSPAVPTLGFILLVMWHHLTSCYITRPFFFLICLSNEEIFLKTQNHPVYREILFIDT